MSGTSSASASASAASAPAVSVWKHLWIPLYIICRIYLANRMPVTDCDEVYNYWEPLHFLLYKKGLQTWEYANEYALRTFAYLVPVQGVAVVWQYLIGMAAFGAGSTTTTTTMPSHQSSWMMMEQLHLLAGVTVDNSNSDNDNVTTTNDKLVLFWCLRATMAAVMAFTEVYWLSTVHQKLRLTTTNLTVLSAVLCTSTGMTHAAAAYLPSATWMGVWMMGSASFLKEQHVGFVVTAVTATLSTGWPFGAVCLVPMGVHILVKEFSKGRAVSFIGTVGAVTVAVQAVVMMTDVQYYGRWVSPTWNIFAYNAGGSGDELYGIEPVSYYVKNLLLNLNLVAPLGLLALPIQLLSTKCHKDWNVVTMLSCIYVWMAITVPRPHKEERFLFPIYPILCLGAVLTVDSALNAIGRMEAAVSRHKELAVRQRVGLTAVVWLPIVLLSMSRSAALAKYYTAPLTIYTALAFQPVPVVAQQLQEQDQDQQQKKLLVCTCGEWYRFPGSFYLPHHAELGFLPSVGFTGQLPQAFSEYGSLAQGQDVLQPFNDENRQEMERYVDMADCTWIIDLEGGECTPDNSRILASAPFLDADKTSALHRILYLPYFHERAMEKGQVHYQDYVLSVLE
jgi:alpha-1,2-mannosyltransferase